MEWKRVKDLMIPLNEYPHVRYWNTIGETLEELKKSRFEVSGHKSLPRFVLVFDEDYQFVGVVRRRDILRGLEPAFLEKMMLPERKRLLGIGRKEINATFAEKFLVGTRRRMMRPINEIMIPPGITVDENDNIVNAIYEIVAHNTSFIVVTRDNEVVGVIRTVELVLEIEKLLQC